MNKIILLSLKYNLAIYCIQIKYLFYFETILNYSTVHN